jgi:hypothetical protein
VPLKGVVTRRQCPEKYNKFSSLRAPTVSGWGASATSPPRKMLNCRGNPWGHARRTAVYWPSSARRRCLPCPQENGHSVAASRARAALADPARSLAASWISVSLPEKEGGSFSTDERGIAKESGRQRARPECDNILIMAGGGIRGFLGRLVGPPGAAESKAAAPTLPPLPPLKFANGSLTSGNLTAGKPTLRFEHVVNPGLVEIKYGEQGELVVHHANQRHRPRALLADERKDLYVNLKNYEGSDSGRPNIPGVHVAVQRVRQQLAQSGEGGGWGATREKTDDSPGESWLNKRNRNA